MEKNFEKNTNKQFKKKLFLKRSFSIVTYDYEYPEIAAKEFEIWRVTRCRR